VHHLGRLVAPAFGEVTVEQVGGLDDVVVHAHEDQVADLHAPVTLPVPDGPGFGYQ